MEWYLPITIVPGVGLLVLSTTAQMMGLSTEIGSLLSKKCGAFSHQIADLKIKQLTRLTRASTLLYISAALFVLAGIWGAISSLSAIADWILVVGVATTFGALIILIRYSYNTIIIRKLQHKHNYDLEKKQLNS